MPTTERKAEDHASIRRRIDSWTKALRAKDVDALLSHYVPDVLSYDLAPPLLHRGEDVQRKGLQEWFPSWEGPLGYEVHDLSITTGDDVAFSTSLNHLTGKKTSGEQVDLWVRATVCYCKRDGRWMVTHEHVSVPFYMDGSYRAAVDLQPQS